MPRPRRLIPAVVLCLAASLAVVPHAGAAVSLTGVGGTYAAPVFVTSDPTDEDRIFVVEQDGRIQLRAGGTTTQFLDIDSLVLSRGEPGAGSEQGMLSMAFAPDFAVSGRFWVSYTADVDQDIRVAEFTASGSSADPMTLKTVISIPHTGPQQIHYAGQLQLGPDGYLYLSTGDAGTAGGTLAQDPSSLLGKLLRIDPTPGGGYTVPGDNPLVGAAGADEVWSLGFRNPWRFSFDRVTGDLLLGDVGQETWEEIDYSPASAGAGRGLNFGWPCREGRHVFTPSCSGVFADPMWEYEHDPPCAVTGGYVVRDPGLEELQGRYIYADLCVGLIRSQIPGLPDATDDQSTGASVFLPTSFGEDACGRTYVASYDAAAATQVFRLGDGTAADCVAPPAILATQPGSPSSDANPSVTGFATSEVVAIDVFTQAGCKGAAASGSRAAFEGPGIAVSVPQNAATTLSARATDADGDTSLCSTGFHYTHALPAEPAPPAGDTTGPGLALGGEERQRLTRRRMVSVDAASDEPGSVAVGGAVTAGKRDKVLFELDDVVAPVSAVTQDVDFKLKRGQARRCLRLIDDGRRVSVRFSGSASDAAGNRGPSAEFVARLVGG